MKIKLTNVGKRFNREWIFRNLNYEFCLQRCYAVTGPNGSGKSTLLQIIAGATTFNEGDIEYFLAGKKIAEEKVYSNISIAAPYLELVEEMTLIEFLQFHSGLKSWLPSSSKLVQGSSSKTTGTSLNIAWANFTLCFMPLLKYRICFCAASCKLIIEIILFEVKEGSQLFKPE